ncbi:MAG: hypothetical protein WDN00_13880 [Limisphaerales bacterium]
MILRGSLAGLDDDLFSGGDRLLRLRLANAGGSGACILDQLVRLLPGVGQNFLAGDFGGGEFSLDLVGVGDTFGDLPGGAFRAW